MNKKLVSVHACEDYNADRVNAAVRAAIDDLGGIAKFVKAGQRVFIKVNLVMAALPEKCITTHPNVVAAVARLVKEAGATPIIGDSPGGSYNKGFVGGVYRKSGMLAMADALGFELNDDFSDTEADFPDGVVAKKIPILGALDKADVIINVAKLKTHTFTGYSAAVKNMYGAIPGLVKIQWHSYYQELPRFANCLVDINEYFRGQGKLVLHVVDAVDGMEGPGPTAGTPVHIGAILASECQYSLDSVCVRIMGDNPVEMPILTTAAERGLLNPNYETDLAGDPIEQFINKKYKTMPPSNFQSAVKSPLVRWLIRRVFSVRPVVSKRKCKGCRKCHDHCPAEAITMHERKPNPVARFDYNKCIRCFCCQELCPFSLIKIKRPLVAKFLARARRKKSKPQK